MKFDQYPAITQPLAADLFLVDRAPYNGATDTKRLAYSDFEASLTRFPILAPSTAAANTIQPTADVVPLVLKGKASQTADLQQWQISDGTVLAGMHVYSLVAGLGSLEFKSGAANGAPAFFGVAGATFDGQYDPIVQWGFNARDGVPVVATEPSSAWVIENDYLTNAIHINETYWHTTTSTTGTPASTQRRWISVRVDRNNPDVGSSTDFKISPTNGNLYISRSDNNAVIYSFTPSGIMGIAGTSPQIQFNAANPIIQVTVPNSGIGFAIGTKMVYISQYEEGLRFGASQDTNIYRSAANTLKTDANFLAVLGLGVWGHAAPASQPILATGAGHTVDDVITTLQNYGLVKQS